jgi:hypothetical protein
MLKCVRFDWGLRLLGFVLAAPVLMAQTPPTNLQLFLLMGQSNMAGRGEITANDLVTHPRIWMLTQDNTWVPARDPVHYDRDYAGVGLASQFARDLAAAEPNTHIGLIPTAVGGSKISEWAYGSLNYNNAVARTRAALANGTLAGILWHQGESDATASGAAAYLDRFSTLMGRLRADLAAYRVPIIAGELGKFRAEHATINPTLAQIPDRVPLAGFATSEGLTDKGDALHFNTPSLYEFGHRYILQWATVDSWHNFEAERLSSRVSGGALTVSATAQASAGNFARFAPTAFGQYVELTLPNVASGTYVVKFRFHRHVERGRCTVSIDGQQLGGEIDQAGSASYSSQLTLGPITFNTSGDRLVRITSTSSGTISKVLSADAIVLEPQPGAPPPPETAKVYEAEALTKTLSGGSSTSYGEQPASAGRWLKFFPTAFGQAISFTIPNVSAGTYELRYRYKRDADRGRCTVWLDGVQRGAEIDQSAATPEFVEMSLGAVTWPASGNHTVRVVASSSSGSSRNLSMDAFILVPTGGPADGPITFESDVIPKALSGGSSISYAEQAASGGRWLKFFPTAFGQSITFTLAGVPAGSYEVKFRYKRDPDRGRTTVWLDGAQISGEIEQYAATAAFSEVSLGMVTWTEAGNHTLRLVASGSSGSSKNISSDAFILVPKSPPTSLTFESDVIPKTLNGGSSVSYGEQGASGGRWLKFFPTAFGQAITFTLANVPAGTYAIKFRYKRDPDRGRSTVWVDGSQMGTEIEQYAAAPDFQDTTVGQVTWPGSGSHTVQIVASGSSGSSKNLAIDAFILMSQ